MCGQDCNCNSRIGTGPIQWMQMMRIIIKIKPCAVRPEATIIFNRFERWFLEFLNIKRYAKIKISISRHLNHLASNEFDNGSKIFRFSWTCSGFKCWTVGSRLLRSTSAFTLAWPGKVWQPAIVKQVQPVIVKKIIQAEAPANYDFNYAVNDHHTGGVHSQYKRAENGAVHRKPLAHKQLISKKIVVQPQGWSQGWQQGWQPANGWQ